MLFAMLQDQHTKQITQIEVANKTNMDAMMEQMNARQSPTGPSTRQGEHPSGKKCHPPWQWQPSQETQAEESPLSQLQMFCITQAGKLLQA
jgi:hypothetical protein